MTVPMNVHHGPERAASVYRFYDETGALLYVGCTTIGLARWATHAAEKSWWPLVSCAQLEHFASNLDAVEEERQAIQGENPRFNVRGGRDKGKGRYGRRKLVAESVDGELGQRLVALRERQSQLAEDRWALIKEAAEAGHSGESIAETLGAHLADVQRVWHFQGPMPYR